MWSKMLNILKKAAHLIFVFSNQMRGLFILIFLFEKF